MVSEPWPAGPWFSQERFRGPALQHPDGDRSHGGKPVVGRLAVCRRLDDRGARTRAVRRCGAVAGGRVRRLGIDEALAVVAGPPLSARRTSLRRHPLRGGGPYATQARYRMARHALPARPASRESRLGALWRRLLLRQFAWPALAVAAAKDLALLGALVALAHVLVSGARGGTRTRM